MECLKDQPFALIGINSDGSAAKVNKILKKELITWRNAIDGTQRGPIASQWRVHAWPTIYVLDAKGVIRFKDARGEQLDQAVAKLLKEMKPESGSLGAMGIAPGIAKLLKDEDAAVRSRTVRTLEILGVREAAPEIVKLLKDESTLVRYGAAQALGSLGAKETVPEIVKLLRDAEAGVRSSAANVLGSLGAKETASEVVKLLQDGDAYVRSLAAWALGALRAKETASEVVKLLKDEDTHVRVSAAQALEMMDAREFVPEIVKLLKDRDPGVRSQVASVLGELGAKETVPEIAKLLQDDDAYVRSSATLALGTLGAKETASEIVRRLKDGNAGVRSSATQALGSLGAKETAPEIVKLLKDGDPDARSWAASSLYRFGLREEVAMFLKDAGTQSRESSVPVPLYTLNALRRPEVWERLGKAALKQDLEGTFHELTEELGRKAGLSMVFPSMKEMGSWKSVIRSRGGQANLLDGLEAFLRTSGYDEMIFEADRIRILPRDEALKFWLAWWREEEKKK
ncbi:MAG: HEAT repeat domain-containing protein [Acidobacteria bacterium]|nr:HEAT repeat domain-containing protein [Acidobacteriota bacterium]